MARSCGWEGESGLDVLSPAFNAIESDAAASAHGGRYSTAIKHYLTLRPVVDAFFTDVMVMVDDATLREARLALLTRVKHGIRSHMGDLSHIGVTS